MSGKTIASAVAIVLLLLQGMIGTAFSAGETVVLTVQEGDSLWLLCQRHLDTPFRWREVAAINGIREPGFVRPGRALRVPADYLKGIPVDATVSFIDGNAVVKDREADPGRPLAAGDIVGRGAFIRVESGSVELSYDDRTTVLLRSGTRLRIAEALQAPELGRRYKLSLQAGKVVSRIREATGQAPRYLIETPSAIAAARGTRFHVHLDSDKVTRCEVHDGTVDVRAGQKRAAVAEGYGVKAGPDRRSLETRRLPAPPPAADLEAVYKDLPAEIRFEAVDGAAAYRVMLASDDAGRSLLAEQVVAPGQPFILPELPDGTFFLLAAGIDDLGLEGIPAAAQRLQVRRNPLPPMVQTPESGQKYRAKQLAFTWLNVSDAAGYRVQVARDEGFSALAAAPEPVSEARFPAPDLEPGDYFFRVASIAADGFQGPWSDVLPFTVLPPLAVPEMEAPEADAGSVRMRWRDEGSGLRYHFQMAADPGFSTPIEDRVLDVPFAVIDRPEAPGVYHVRTSTIGPDGDEGDFGAAQTFTIEKSFPWGPVGLMVLTMLGAVLL